MLAHQPSATDLLFITLRKNEALFSASAAGQRTIHHAAWGSRVLLFVRDQRRLGMVTEPFVCLGFARYESHEGKRPMAIRWRLEQEIPAAWMPGCSSPSLALAV